MRSVVFASFAVSHSAFLKLSFMYTRCVLRCYIITKDFFKKDLLEMLSRLLLQKLGQLFHRSRELHAHVNRREAKFASDIV